jgi:hypothetical protein
MKTPELCINSRNQSAWDIWEQNLLNEQVSVFSERNQPQEQQKREEIDKLFSIGTTGQIETV